MVWQHDDHLLPYNPSLRVAYGACQNTSHSFTFTTYLRVVDVVYLIEDHELDVTDKISTFVEHASEYLRSHNKAVGLGINLYISGQDANRIGGECLLEISELLIR